MSIARSVVSPIARPLVRALVQGDSGGGGTPAPTLTFLQGAVDAANSTSYTFSGQSLGAAADDRLIVVCVHGRATSALAITGVTVGGVTASQVATATRAAAASPTSFSRSSIYVAEVPSGTSGDVVVTFDATSLRCAIQMYRLTGVSATAVDTGSSIVTPPTDTLTVPANGLVIATASCASNDTGESCVWTGLTEDYDQRVSAVEALTTSSASLSLPAGGSLEITATFTGDFANLGLFAAWGPA